MNIYTPIIFQDIIFHTFAPTPTPNPWDLEWISEAPLSGHGNGGEILEITVDANGTPGAEHGITGFAMYIANYNFAPLITFPRTLQTGNVGPDPSQIIFYSGNIAVTSNVLFNNTYPIYNQSFKIPVPYLNGTGTKVAFLARGINLDTNLRISVRGRRTQ